MLISAITKAHKNGMGQTNILEDVGLTFWSAPQKSAGKMTCSMGQTRFSTLPKSTNNTNKKSNKIQKNKTKRQPYTSKFDRTQGN